MAKARISYLSDDEKQFIHEKTLQVLAEVGIAYNTPKAIDLLEAAGAQVDREALTARLTWDVIEPALKTVPRHGPARRPRRGPRRGARRRPLAVHRATA